MSGAKALVTVAPTDADAPVSDATSWMTTAEAAVHCRYRSASAIRQAISRGELQPDGLRGRSYFSSVCFPTSAPHRARSGGTLNWFRGYGCGAAGPHPCRRSVCSSKAPRRR
jgi:hypothetical protein